MVTQEAMQRCADLTNEERAARGWEDDYTALEFERSGESPCRAFARYVQSVSDTMAEIVRVCEESLLDAIDRIEALARSFILPEPVDPVERAMNEALCSDDDMTEAAHRLRAALDKAGFAITKKEG